MRRDAELLRRIVLAVADAPYGWDIEALDGHERQSVAWHVSLLLHDGLATAIDTTALTRNVGLDFINVRLTGRGCDLAALARPEARWRPVATRIAHVVGSDAPLALYLDALLAAARRELS
jgi:hypothetical protein